MAAKEIAEMAARAVVGALGITGVFTPVRSTPGATEPASFGLLGRFGEEVVQMTDVDGMETFGRVPTFFCIPADLPWSAAPVEGDHLDINNVAYSVLYPEWDGQRVAMTLRLKKRAG